MTNNIIEYQYNGFLTLDQQITISLKAKKLDYDCCFNEYGATTIITFTKDQK